MFCKHHYQYTQGHFVCAKCGNRRYSSRVGRRGNKKKIAIPIIITSIALLVIVVYFGDISIPRQISESPIQDIPKIADDVREKIPEIEKQIDAIKEKVDSVSESIKIPDVPAFTKPEFDSAKIEGLIHTFTNEERAKNGLAGLVMDSRLSGIARGHSVDMAERNYFSHDTPEGLDPSARASRAGYSCHKELGGGYYTEGIAENVAQHWLFTSYVTRGVYASYDWQTEESLAREIVDGWMSSPGHRQNILTGTYDRIGIGIGISADDAVYATQNFC